MKCLLPSNISDKLSKFITVAPDNDLLKPYTINKSEIIEVWKYVCNISFDDNGQMKSDDLTAKDVYVLLKKELDEMKKSLYMNRR